MALAGHQQHGRATYVQSDIADASSTNQLLSLTPSVWVATKSPTCKPPPTDWTNAALPAHQHTSIYVGDFNSHHATWGYEHADSNGDWLMEWSSQLNLSLVIDLKQKLSFHSARWDRDYSPDLCWVTSYNGQHIQTSLQVLDDFPHSQHIVAHVGLRIPLIRSLQKPRWNFRNQNGPNSLNNYTEYQLQSQQRYLSDLAKPSSYQPSQTFHEASGQATYRAWTLNVNNFLNNTQTPVIQISQITSWYALIMPVERDRRK